MYNLAKKKTRERVKLQFHNSTNNVLAKKDILQNESDEVVILILPTHWI